MGQASNTRHDVMAARVVNINKKRYVFGCTNHVRAFSGVLLALCMASAINTLFIEGDIH